MKKGILLLVVLSLIIVGCDKKEKDIIEENKNTTNEQQVQEDKQNDETKPAEDTKEPDETKPVEDTKKPDETKPVEDTKKPDETKPAEDAKKPDETKPAEDTKKPDETKPVEDTKPKCTPKKFNHKYTWVYTTEKECMKQGNNVAFFEVTDNIDNGVFAYGCDKIVDECGTTWYGVSFSKWSEEKEEVYQVYY